MTSGSRFRGDIPFELEPLVEGMGDSFVTP
jgi:hypothetical protein